MDITREKAGEGAGEGLVVLAEEQSRGRGRLGREWLSPGGSLSLSILLRPTLPLLPSLIMLASLAVVHTIEENTGLKASIKWPNDVLMRGKKVCGILIENAIEGHKVLYSIIGIGLNVNLDTKEYPQIASLATSLSQELGREVNRQQVLQSLLEEIEELYLGLQQGVSLYQEWQGRLETLGKRVRATGGDRVEEGYAEAVDKEGSLLLRRSDGSLIRILAGDVTLASPPTL